MKNWAFTIKTAALAMYSAERQVQNANIDLELANRFFNFLMRDAQSPKAKDDVKPNFDKGTTEDELKHENEHIAQLIPFYHGTSILVPNKMDDFDMMTAPINTRQHQREKHASNQYQIFTSRSKGYADGYSQSYEGTEKVMMTFRIPLYALNEVRTAIFNPFLKHPYTYSEQNHHLKLAKIVQPALRELGAKLENLKVTGTKKKEVKEIERQEFAKLLKNVNSYVVNQGKDGICDSDEWTPVNGIQERFLDDIKIMSGENILGKTSYKDIIKAYKTDQNFKTKFVELLKTHPYYSWVLSIDKDWVKHDDSGKIIKDKHNRPVKDDPMTEKVIKQTRKGPDGKPLMDHHGNPIVEWLTPKDIARQGWAEWVAQNPSGRVGWLPEHFLHDSHPVKVAKLKGDNWGSLEKATDPTTGHAIEENIPMSRWFRDSFLSSFSKTVAEMKSWDDCMTRLQSIPALVQAALAPQIRETILKFGTPSSPSQADAYSQSLHVVHSSIFKDGAFVDQLNTQLISQMTPQGIWKIFKWTGEDTNKFRPWLINNPTIFKTYISKVPPSTVVWNRWDHKFLESMAPLIRERIKASIQEGGVQSLLTSPYSDDDDDGSDGAHTKGTAFGGDIEYGAGIMSMPGFLLDGDIQQTLENRAIEQANENFSEFILKYLRTLPPKIQKGKALYDLIYNKLSTESFAYSIWEACPIEITDKPELAEKKQAARIVSEEITSINFEDMTTPTLKDAYITKMCEYLENPHDGYGWYSNIHDSLKKLPKILEATAKGYANRVIKAAYYNVPGPFDQKIYDLPEFEPYRDIVDGAKIIKNYEEVDYAGLKPALKKQYLERLVEEAHGHAALVLSLYEKVVALDGQNPEIQPILAENHDKIWQGLAKGVGDTVANQELNYPQKIDIDPNDIGDIPKGVLTNPEFLKFKNDYYQQILASGCLTGIDPKTLNPEMTSLYLNAARLRVRKNPLWYTKFADVPEIANNEGVIDGLSYGYRNTIVNKTSLPEEFLKLIDPLKGKINQYMIDNGMVAGIFFDHLAPEQSENYKFMLSNKVAQRPELFDQIDPKLQNDPAILLATARAYATRFSSPSPHVVSISTAAKGIPTNFIAILNNTPSTNSDIDEAKQQISSAQNNLIQFWKNLLSQGYGYKPIEVFRNIPGNMLTGELAALFIDSIKTGKIFQNMTDMYGYGVPDSHKVQRMEEYIKAKKDIPEDVQAAMTQAIEVGGKAIKLKGYIDNPYEFPHIEAEERAKLLPELVPLVMAKAEEMVSAANIPSLLQWVLSMSPIMDGAPTEYQKLKDFVENKFIEQYNNLDAVTRKRWDHYAQYYASWSPKITELAKSSPEKLNKLVTHYIDTMQLEHASREAIDALKKDPTNKGYRDIKEKAVDAWCKKIEEAPGQWYRERYYETAKGLHGWNNKKLKAAFDPAYKAELQQKHVLHPNAPAAPVAPTLQAPLVTPSPTAENPATPMPAAPVKKGPILPKAPVLPKKPGPGLKDKSDSYKSLFSLQPFFDLKNGKI